MQRAYIIRGELSGGSLAEVKAAWFPTRFLSSECLAITKDGDVFAK